MNIKVNSKIEMLPIGNIKRHYGSHKTTGALKLLEESIRRYGITQPISVDSNHEVITGNGVYDAAVKLGIEQLPCIVVDYLTDEEITQYRLADNLTGGFAAWNEGKLKKELSYLQDMQSVQFCFDESLQAHV
ncbi:MAG: ParB N-terminal domain-containing protein [Alistipes indistinctus]